MHATTYDLGTVNLSAIERSPAGDLRATIVALHGGGYSAGYWDHPLDPTASLLTVGAELGYRVVALDRPGYGASFGLAGEAVRVANPVPVLFDCIDAIRRSGLVGAGCFLMGHSMGAIVAIHMAASARGGELLGIDVSGVPLHMDGSLTEDVIRGMPDHMPDSPVEFRRGLFYGPDGTFDQAVLAADEAVTRPIPCAEIIDAVRCGVDVPQLGSAVTVPVQFTRAEFEVSSRGGREQLDEARTMFVSSRRYEGHWQAGSGHNISLHRVARAHHLRAIAFFDEVLARGSRGRTAADVARRSCGRPPRSRRDLRDRARAPWPGARPRRSTRAAPPEAPRAAAGARPPRVITNWRRCLTGATRRVRISLRSGVRHRLCTASGRSLH